MRLIPTLFLVILFNVLSIGQLYQGPADGSVPSGVTINTAAFTENNYVPPKTFNPKPLRNLFTRSYIADTKDMPKPTAPEGANYFEDPLGKSGDKTTLSGDFVLTRNFQGIPDQGWFIPPDPYVAVGPTHIMAVVNSRFRIYDKQGTVLSTIEASNWYNSTLSGADPFDPKITYDQYAKRWVMVWLNVSSNMQTAYYLVSVSDDSIPTGTWYNWKLPSTTNGNTAAGNWGDYQGVGYDEQAIYLTSNQFTSTGSYNYVKIRIIKKSDLYANTAGAVNWKDLWNIKDASGNTVFGTRPARMYGASSSFYFVSRSPYVTGTYFTLYKLVNPLTTPSMTAVNVPVTAYSDPDDAQQLGSTQRIDGGGSYIRNEPVYRNGKLYLVHAVRSGTGGSSSAVRYVAVDVNSNTVIEDKSMGAEGYFHFYPALEVDKDENIVMTYTRSSSSEYAGAYYTTKPVSSINPTGSKLLKAGSGYYYKTFGGDRNRWGDYNGAWIDPADQSKIWIFTEYVASTNTWGSWVGELTYQTQSNFVTVTSPDGGENWQVGSSKNITWTSGNVSNVKIEYSTNNGTNWIVIASSVSAAGGSYAWTVPATPSNQCLVKISDVLNSSIFDVSNSTFMISTSGFDWDFVSSGTTGDIWQIDYVNSSVIWLIAANGDVRRSTDGGTTWISAGNVGTQAYTIAAIDAQTALVATGPDAGNGAIVKTTNGGANWVQKYTATGAWFNVIDNISESVLWAQSDPTDGSFHIVKSTNGGETWALTANRPAQPATNVYGANGSFYRINNTIWFGCGGATGATLANRVYKSTNGPDGPWTSATTTAQYTGTISFTTPEGNGLVGFWQATNTLNGSLNGGSSWTSITAPIGLTHGLDYINNTPYCWAATSTGLWRTTNHGTAWTADVLPTGVSNGLNCVKFYDDANIGLAGGPGGILLKSRLQPVIPVELTSFTASLVENTISLNWRTASEINNLGFELQRKTDSDWSTISFIKGKGTTTEITNYNYVDDFSDYFFTGIVYYRLKQIDFDGKFTYSDEIKLDVDLTAKDYVLHQNHPNPFNPTTVISFGIPKAGMVTLKIFDNLGREVQTLVNEEKPAGTFRVEFDGSNLASGIYYYRLQSGSFISTKKFVLMK